MPLPHPTTGAGHYKPAGMGEGSTRHASPPSSSSSAAASPQQQQPPSPMFFSSAAASPPKRLSPMHPRVTQPRLSRLGTYSSAVSKKLTTAAATTPTAAARVYAAAFGGASAGSPKSIPRAVATSASEAQPIPLDAAATALRAEERGARASSPSAGDSTSSSGSLTPRPFWPQNDPMSGGGSGAADEQAAATTLGFDANSNAASSDAAAAAVHHFGTRPSNGARPFNVLLVDDHALSRKLCAAMLERRGMQARRPPPLDGFFSSLVSLSRRPAAGRITPDES